MAVSVRSVCEIFQLTTNRSHWRVTRLRECDPYPDVSEQGVLFLNVKTRYEENSPCSLLLPVSLDFSRFPSYGTLPAEKRPLIRSPNHQRIPRCASVVQYGGGPSACLFGSMLVWLNGAWSRLDCQGSWPSVLSFTLVLAVFRVSFSSCMSGADRKCDLLIQSGGVGSVLGPAGSAAR